MSSRKPEAISSARAMGFNPIVGIKYFDLYKSKLDLHNFASNRIWNVDETPASVVPETLRRIIATKGRKKCVSASGDELPPLFIYARKRMKDNLLDNITEGAWAKTSDSGYINQGLFQQWFEWFIVQVKPKKKIYSLSMAT